MPDTWKETRFIIGSGKGRWCNVMWKDSCDSTHDDNKPPVPDDLDKYLFTGIQLHAVI